MPPWYFTVVAKEVLLRDRLIGFKHWGQTAYGRQAVTMLRSFGDEFDMAWLDPQLRREAVADAYAALRALASSGVRPTDEYLDAMIDTLRGRAATADVGEDLDE